MVEFKTFLWETSTFMCYTANIMDVDGLATQGARSSAAMVLTYFPCNSPASAP